MNKLLFIVLLLVMPTMALQAKTSTTEIVPNEVLKQWGYGSGSLRYYSVAFCDPGLEDKAQVSYQGLRQGNFDIIKEVYATEASAEQRLAEIKNNRQLFRERYQEANPMVRSSKYSKTCTLHQSFRQGKAIYSIHTNSISIYHSDLNKVVKQLKGFLNQGKKSATE